MRFRAAAFLVALLAASVIALNIVAGLFVGFADDFNPLPSRSFEFTYKVTVPALPPTSAPLRVWIPLPDRDAFQSIADINIAAPVKYKIEDSAEYGNRFAVFLITAAQASSPFDIVLTFKATRYEHRVSLTAVDPVAPVPGKISVDQAPTNVTLALSLEPDRLVPINGVIAELAKQNTAGATDTLDKARRIYEYVVSTMRYDKTGEGWGHGDAIWACTSKRGNCTDFHSLFIGMARASGIPARFEIGFPLPAGQISGDIPGYHCWAEFYVKGIGWVPIDASEAWKHPEKHAYFFGAHDVNRIQFTTGRDLRLDDTQKSEPLNYFIYPYAELDGKPFDKLQWHFAFRDIPAINPPLSLVNKPSQTTDF